MTAGDIMTRDVVSVEKDRKISEIAALLVKNRIHGIPVVDKEKKIIGMITETDFFSKNASSIHLPSFIDLIKSQNIEEEFVEKNQDFKYVLDAVAKDIMSTDCFYVTSNMKIEDLIQIFKETSYKTIPVSNEVGILVGIVSLSDIIKLI